jgi:hypothetical protein
MAQSEDLMLVQVQWTNKMYDYVEAFMLDHLIAQGGVLRFLRSTGWATIGVDATRSATPAPYIGQERRAEYRDCTKARARSASGADAVNYLNCGNGTF